MASLIKKDKSKSRIIKKYWYALDDWKRITGRICQVIHRHAKLNNKYIKNYDKDIKSSYLAYLDANNVYGWAMSQKLVVNGFKWVEKLSRLWK